jgi:glutathione-independent formaldehyde dehydrogenase
VVQVFVLGRKNKGIELSSSPGEKKMKGKDCVIDAVGYQARDHKAPSKEKPAQVLETCLRMMNSTGNLGVACLYLAPVKKYNEYLRDLIINGRTKPSKIVSHHSSIEDVPEAYQKFDKRIEGYTKVLLRFGDSKASVASA